MYDQALLVSACQLITVLLFFEKHGPCKFDNAEIYSKIPEETQTQDDWLIFECLKHFVLLWTFFQKIRI